MYEIDFLPVESESGAGSKSGDAIALRFTVESEQRQAVVVIDGGFTDVGYDLAGHVRDYYETSYVDLVISTHPDADHINGLTAVIETLDVGELMLHQPRLHTSNIRGFSNLEAVDELLRLAEAHRVPVTEPFAGASRFGGQLVLLGPTTTYYENLIEAHLSEVRSGKQAPVAASGSRTLARLGNLWEKALTALPIETLDDEGETSPRNNSSAITLVQADGHRLLFTGDAGIPALERACLVYERTYGSFANRPLTFFQAPHHGSKRNLGPTILNRILDGIGAPHGVVTAFISSARASVKHPSPKVTNALRRRGCTVAATEGKAICDHHGTPTRPGWGPVTPIPPLPEDVDDD